VLIKQHVTHVRSDHRSNMLHFVNRFVVEVPQDIPVFACDLWKNVNRVDFGNWLQSNDDEIMNFANNNWISFLNRADSMPLKSLYHGTPSSVKKSDITILAPLFNLGTQSYEDIKVAIDDFFMKYMNNTDRLFAIVSGDQQTWIRLWLLHLQNPTEYHWMIPVPGEWHWTWHIIKAIFRLYYYTILLPFSRVLGFSKLDKKADNFHYAEDLLEMVTVAIQRWIIKCLAEHPPGTTVSKWLEYIRTRNVVAYETAYACIHYFIPYWITRSALKWNKINDMEIWWRYWIHLFIATGKRNYSIMSIRFLWVLRSMHPAVKAAYEQHRVLSFSGDPGTGIPFDGVIELVCNLHCFMQN
jgi:hypothetical protein